MRIAADAYRDGPGPDPRAWLLSALFHRKTGSEAAAFGTGRGQEPGQLPRRVTGGHRIDDPYEVELGEIVRESNDGRALEMVLHHGRGAPRSRIALETTRVGADDVVLVRHTGWTDANITDRADFLDWQRRLDEWAASLTGS